MSDEEKMRRFPAAALLAIIGGAAFLIFLGVAGIVAIYLIGRGSEQQFITAITEAAPPTDTPVPGATATPVDFEDEEGEEARLPDRVEVTSNGTGTLGDTIFTVTLCNDQASPQGVLLPAGTYLSPPPGQQRMMLLKTIRAEVAANNCVDVQPYVACIDVDAHAPEAGAGYSFGGVVEEPELEEFAMCLDGLELPSAEDEDAFMQQFGLQAAVWSVAEGTPPGAMDFSDLSALSAFDDSTRALIEPILIQMGEGTTYWLEECGVEIKATP